MKRLKSAQQVDDFEPNECDDETRSAEVGAFKTIKQELRPLTLSHDQDECIKKSATDAQISNWRMNNSKLGARYY